MNIKLSKRFFVENLLTPASKLTDNVCLDKSGNTLKTIASSNDNSTILLANLPCEANEDFKCIVPDVKTFLRLFGSIDSDDISLQLDSNLIKYSSSSLSFKYHLLDESYASNKKSLSEEKLNQLTFDTEFSLNKSKLSEIFKFNSIVPDAEKLYFYTKGEKVFAKIGDEQKSNTNEINLEVSDTFEGSSIEEGIPLNVQNVLLLSFNDDKIVVKINHKLKIFKFETSNTKYIISGLVK